jgi:presenilin-like A22 family membrane protease
MVWLVALVETQPAGHWDRASTFEKGVYFFVQLATPLVAVLALRDATRFGLRGLVLALLVLIASYSWMFSIFVLTGTYPLTLVPLLAFPFVLWRKRVEWNLAWWQRSRWR